MSVKSTHYITESLAREIIINKVATLSLSEVEVILEDLKESVYRNYIIVQKLKSNETPAITSIDEFNDVFL